jgi:hypothetical protein
MKMDNAGGGDRTVGIIIIISVLLALLAFGAYLLIIRKYYWGPKGAPKKTGGNKTGR